MNIKSKQFYFSLQFLQNKEIFGHSLVFQIESIFFLTFQYKVYMKIEKDIEKDNGQ